MNLRDIEKMLKVVECPLCASKDFDFKLRCDLDYERCLTTVQCLRCRYEFEAEQLVRSKNKGGSDSRGTT